MRISPRKPWAAPVSSTASQPHPTTHTGNWESPVHMMTNHTAASTPQKIYTDRTLSMRTTPTLTITGALAPTTMDHMLLTARLTHPVEEGNHLHKGKDPTECDEPIPVRALRMTVRKSTGGMMSVPRVKLTNQHELNHCPPFLIRIKTTARKSIIQYLPSRTLAPKRPAEFPHPPTPAAPRTKQTARKSTGGMGPRIKLSRQDPTL